MGKNDNNLRGINNIKITNGQQTNIIFNYKNTKEQFFKSNAAI
jgi:hypothetical protein